MNTIPVDKLNGNCFLDAVMTKDIAELTIISPKEKKAVGSKYKRGEPDILVRHLDGRVERLYRTDVNGRFRHPNGKAVRLLLLKNSTKYPVYIDCDEKYKAVKVPKSYRVDFNGRRLNGGGYIICKVDDKGAVLKETLRVISSDNFKRAFRIPESKYIKRVGIRENGTGRKKLGVEEMKNGLANIRRVEQIQTDNRNTVVEKKTEVVEKKTEVVKEDKSKYKYRVYQRITNIDKKVVGYAIEEITTGRKKNITTKQLATLCSMKVVENVMLVTREDGTKFLKGNGIKLENIPSVLL